MKAKTLAPILLIVVAAAAVGFLLWQKTSKTNELIEKAIPGIPENIANATLQKRIQAATTDAQKGPDRLEALATLSRLYHANGYTQEAWRCYATLIAVDPKEPKWPYLLGRIIAGYGQLEEAAPLFERSIELAPDYLPARIRLGDTLLKQNEFESAEAVYQEVIDQDSRNTYALVGLARVAIAREDWELARAYLEDSIKYSNFQIGADLLADVYEKLGLPAQETVVLQNASWGSYADIPDPWSLSLMDDSYDAYQVSTAGGWVVHQGDLPTGLRYVKRAVELDPERPTLHYQIAGIYMKLGDLESAEKHFRKCVELQPDFADAWLALIEIAKSRQSPTTVRRTLDMAMRAAPDSPSLNIERGKLLVSMGRPEQALEYLQRSIDLRPHEAIGYIELAKAYLAMNEIEKGIEQMRIALKREPGNPLAITTLAYSAIASGNKDEADHWFVEMGHQARIATKELSQLTSMYRQQFGSLPPR